MVTSARGSGARFYFLVSWVIYLAEEKFQGERVLKLSAAPSKPFYWEGHPRNSEPHVWLPRLMQIVTSGGRELSTERENKLSTGEENYLSACISDKIKSSLSLHWRYIPGNWDMLKKKSLNVLSCYLVKLLMRYMAWLLTEDEVCVCMYISSQYYVYITVREPSTHFLSDVSTPFDIEMHISWNTCLRCGR